MKACIFDLDGTLTSTLDSLEYSTNATMREIGMPEITKDQCRRFVGNGANGKSGRGAESACGTDWTGGFQEPREGF